MPVVVALLCVLLGAAPTNAWALSAACADVNRANGTHTASDNDYGYQGPDGFAADEVIHYSYSNPSGPDNGPYVNIMMYDPYTNVTRPGVQDGTATSGSGTIKAITNHEGLYVFASDRLFTLSAVQFPVEPARTNKSFTITISCSVAEPTLGLSVSHTGTPRQGQSFSLTPTLSNTGDAITAGAATLTATLPTGLTYSGFSGANWNCAGSSGAAISCVFSGTIAAGASNSALSIVTDVSASSATSRTVTMAVSGGGASNTPSASDTIVMLPTIVSITPTSGPSGGGSSVVITGTNLFGTTGAAGVRFGGTNATSYTVDSNTQITAMAPAHSAGTIDVTVTNGGNTSATLAADRYTFVGAPTVTGRSPTSGPATGGTTVVITGTGFAAAPGTGAVKFGATNATYTINSNTQITATSPANSAGTYDITVTTTGGTSATSAADQFTYVAAPAVTSISPATGPISGGTTVTITGTGFSGATAVAFGGTAATGFTVDSATQITATAPSGTGTVDIRVTTVGGTSTASAADRFTYATSPAITSISPTAGLSAGGTTVTITGSGFSGATTVNFGGTAATGFSVNSATQITATAPAGTGTVDIRVTTPGGTSATGAADRFTYLAPLVLSPAAGALPGGTSQTAYSQTFTVTGGATPYGFGSTGTLPSGLSLSSSGVLSGTPTASGTFNFTVNVSDGSAASAGSALTTSASYSITIAKAAQTITFNPLSDASLSASPLTLAATASSGLTVGFSSTTTGVCTVSGTNLTLLTTGTCTIAADQAGDVAHDVAPTVTHSFNVLPATLLITANPPTGTTVGAAYSQGNPVSGGTAPYTYALGAGALPSGTTLDASTGTVSGTPATAGTFSYRIQATDSQATPATATGATVTTTIAKGNQTISFTAPDNATVGDAPVNLSATASSSLVVTLALDGTSTGCTLSGNTVSFVGTGTCRIDATQPGDANWNAAPQVQKIIAVGAAGSVTATLTFTPASLGVGSAGTMTLTFTNPNPSATPNIAPLLTVSALLNRVGGAPGGSCGASGSDSGNDYQFNGFAIPSGSCTVTLTYSGKSAGSSAGLSLGAFTPSGYPTVPATVGNGFVVVPTVSSISPNSGPVSQAVTVSGTGFSTTPGNNIVKFGATPGTVTAASATSLTVTAPASGSGPATVTVTVNGETSTTSVTYSFIDPPAAANKPGVAVPYNSPGTAIDLASSISGSPHSSIAIGAAAAHGTTSVAGDVVTYVPVAGYFGADSFTYTATGAGGTSNVATVSLTVATPSAPVAADKNGVAVPYAGAGTGIDLSESITGVHSSITIAAAPAHGTATATGDVVTYTPVATYYGTDSFTYTATGPGGTSAPATVSLVVATPPAPVTADRRGISVPYASTGTAVDLSSSITGARSSIAIAAAPAHGTVTIAGEVVTYTPVATYYGADSFTYTATGPGGTSAPSTVSLAVATPGVPTTANKTGVDIGYDSAGTAIDLAPSITGVHSILTISTAPTHGTTSVSGDVVTYVPTAGYYGTDSFAYTATGPGGTSAVATVSLVVATPPPPVAVAGTGTVRGSTTTAGTSVNIDLSALVTGVYDTIRIADAPAHGTVTLSGAAGPMSPKTAAAAIPSHFVATYTPAAGFAGTDGFTFTATGPGGTSAPAMVTVTVVGEVPVAMPKTAATGDGQMASVMLTDDAQRGPFTGATVVTVAPVGSATTSIVAANGGYRLDVTPNNRFGGAIVITYTLSNAYGASAPSTVTLAVQARPDPRNDPDVGAISDAQSEAARRFARAQVSNFMRRTEQLHHGGGQGGGVSMGVTLNSTDGTMGMQQRPTDQNWGLAITERMRMSGEDPAIGQFANNPQSPLSRPDQLGNGRAIAPAGAGASGAGAAKKAVDTNEDGTRRTGSVATWAGGAIDIGTRDKTTDRTKVTATTAGLSAGADIKLGDGIVVGVGGGYGNDLSQIGTAAQVRGTSTLYAAYASIEPTDGAFIDGVIGRGRLDFTTRRLAATVDATARGSRDGDYTVAALSLGIDRAGRGALAWSLYGRGEYTDADLDAYSESGAGRYNLRFDARQVRSITGTLGGRIEYRQKTGFGSIIPRLRAEWSHEFADVDQQWLDYADIPGAAAYALSGQGWKREQLQLSLGTRFDIAKGGWSFDSEIGLRAGQGEKAGTLQVRATKQF